ncbi:heavy metal-associated isoprenylated plant protein 36-like [Chenopodium quinoa]|uniref:heavy metal-associated isoprenylated plant protein 36-like n=1 Tax=Chenopodium quinoa TaxID=63459 RepID=UPI000B7804EA|nr:heavy metal-associated isoprenylated plant protein 36-like [Chenopodium quinoa]
MAAPPQCPDPDNSEPLKYKTWVLRVSIHCEGCKRKVKRILHSVEGVYTIDVDTRQHKVVVTGNVDANTLLRKLEKSGKHAELWPDFYKNEQQQQQQFQNQNQNPNVVEEQQQNNNTEPQKVPENNPPQQQQQQPQVKEVRFEANIPATGDSQQPPGNGGGGGGGGAKKKKKKKKGGQNGNNTTNNAATPNNGGGGGNGETVTEQVANGGPPSGESQPPPQQNPNPSPNPNPNPYPENVSPPRQHPPNTRVYEYPPTTYYAPPPVYAVSYNTAYPSSNYTASYYSAPPPYSYAYVHHGGDVEGFAPLDWNPHAAPPSDSFEIFSDENPNACSVM